MNYKETAKTILELVGGSENIVSAKHCVTRLRFVLKDEGIAKTEELKQLKEVISVIRQMEQYQVVIGQEVGNVFAELEKLLQEQPQRKKAAAADNVKIQKPEKKGVVKYLANMISSSFIPIIGIFAGSGFIKALLVIFTTVGFLSAESNTYTVLYAAADAVFYFFPVFLGYTAMKFFDGNPFLGMAIGAAMLYPDIAAAAPDIFGAYTEGAEITSFLGIPVQMIAYSNTVFPIIVAAFAANKLEKLCKKIIPQVVQLFVIPAVVLVIVFPLTLVVLGPIVSSASNILAEIILAIYNLSPIFCGLILAGIWVLVIMFGLHWAFIPVYINNMMTFGYEPLEGLLFAPLFGYVGICLAIAVKTKDKEFRSLNISCAIQSCLGCTEPALYGVLLPLKKPLVIDMIASGIGGAIAGAMHTVYYGAGITGIFAITLAISPDGIGMGFWGMIVSALAATVIGFVLTMFVYQGEVPGETSESDEKENKIYAPLTGNYIPLNEVEDEVFSSGTLGAGCGIRPEEGMLYAPVNGIVTMIADTKHAIGISSDDGGEYLLHIGLDTVKMNGKGFQVKVTEGERVSVGQLLAEFDLQLIQESGYPTTTVFVLTNTDEFATFDIRTGCHRKAGNEVGNL